MNKMRLWKRMAAGLWIVAVAANLLWAQGLPAVSASYGLSLDAQGRLVYSKNDPVTGQSAHRVLDPVLSERLRTLFNNIPAEQADSYMVQVLKNFLEPSLGAVQEIGGLPLYERDSQGHWKLTEAGKKILMDLLTAEDGTLLNASRKALPSKVKLNGLETLKWMRESGVLALSGLAGGRAESSLVHAGKYFENSGMQETYAVPAYDWDQFGQLSRENASAIALDKEKNTVRMIIAAKSPVQADRYLVKHPESEADRIYWETGLNASLLSGHGARVVRAVDNLVAVDVPVPQARDLAKALEGQGVASRPASVLRLVTQALAQGPAWPDPLYQALPFPRSQQVLASSDFHAMNGAGARLMNMEALWKLEGGKGKNTVVAVVDSGLDLSHPDFKDRVVGFLDFTGDGLKDTIAHGTHVAGSIGGSGSASGGKYAGMGPEQRFLVLKVFGGDGSTTEDTILAALKSFRTLPPGMRPDVVNMSLGGPGDPDADPLSILANDLMIRDNIFVAVAAGNSGPKKYSIGSPGNARYVMTVSGTDKSGNLPFFPSRGPIRDSHGKEFNKPDIMTVAGDVNEAAKKQQKQQGNSFLPFLLGAAASPASALDGTPSQPQVPPEEEPKDPGCWYAPGGVISTRSSQDADDKCSLKANSYYRYMTGTSMATPMESGIAGDVISYIKEKGAKYRASEIKAVQMETARNLGLQPEEQGAGMVDGVKLAKVLQQRVEAGLPVGNVAYMLAFRAGGFDRWYMLQSFKEYRFTPVGLLNTKTGYLVNTDSEMQKVLQSMQTAFDNLPFYERWSLKWAYYQNQK